MHFMLKIARKYYTPNSTKSNETKRTMEEKKKYSHNKRHSYECVVSEFCVLCFLTASLFSLTFVCRTGVVHALHMHSTMMIRSTHTHTPKIRYNVCFNVTPCVLSPYRKRNVVFVLKLGFSFCSFWLRGAGERHFHPTTNTLN